MTRITLAGIGILFVGCARAPSTPQAPVPPADQGLTAPERPTDGGRPMPRNESGMALPPPPYEDAPIVNEPMPEQSAFVDTYNRVGRPRIAVISDRPDAQRNDFDAEASRNDLSDWLACGGRVTMVAASDAKDADQTADVVVKLTGHSLPQNQDAPRVRLYAEAFNTKDRVSIGRAFVDVPFALEKPQINRYTRWLARKLMDDMTASWLQPEPAAPREQAQPATAPSR